MKTIIAIFIAIFYAIYDFFLNCYDYFVNSYLLLKAIGLAVTGGFADYMVQRKNKNEDFNFRKAFFHCFIAGFTGFLAQKLCLGFEVNQDLTSFIIGISGFAGTRMLVIFEKIAQAIIKKFSVIKNIKKIHFEVDFNEDKEKGSDN